MDKDYLLKRIDELKRSIEMGAGQLNQMIGRLHELEDMLKMFECKSEQVEQHD